MTINLQIQSNVLMGLLAAIFWGGGDFSGGMGAKHAGSSIRAALQVILVSHASSFCILMSIALLRHDALPQRNPLLWALLAGVIGGVSLTCFYIALARGAMGASAAISGLLAASVPAAFSLASDGSPGPMRLVGFAIAGIAIWMVAAAPTGDPESSATVPARSTLALAVIAGAGFGLYFIALKLAGTGGVAWPMAIARIGSISTCTLLILTLTLSGAHPSSGASKMQSELTDAVPTLYLDLPGKAILWSLATAALDTCGNLLYISATRTGRLDVAAVLASLYPATTILLAGVVLKERISKRQALGMAAAAAAVVMVSLEA